MTVYGILLAGLVLATGLTAGVFLAFSDFIMRGLSQAAPGAGAAGMIGLNRTVLRSVFLTSFFLIIPFAAGLAWWAPDAAPTAVRWLIGLGVGVYAVLVFGITLLANVPMNKALEASGGAEDVWQRYQRVWTAWNHIRTLGTTLSFAAFLTALTMLT
ncbi:DUF1772 domain-containing protein [Oceanicaulis sp.]|uniref:anthrone oxygenase family protein n=1 Tax=Oceanicaulis sp. TaxID=1924941 RepID=UPI003D2A6F5C